MIFIYTYHNIKYMINSLIHKNIKKTTTIITTPKNNNNNHCDMNMDTDMDMNMDTDMDMNMDMDMDINNSVKELDDNDTNKPIYSNNPSICIPRVFTNLSSKFIIKIFQNKLNIGPVKKVDVIYNHTTDENNSKGQFKKVFIHFHYWNNNKSDIRTLINEGKTIKIVYDNPRFWICSLSRGKRPNNSI
jgi:hypothetical protein